MDDSSNNRLAINEEEAKTAAFDLIREAIEMTGINPLILNKIIRGLCIIGDGYGSVTAWLENGICTFVKTEESFRVQEKLITGEQNGN